MERGKASRDRNMQPITVLLTARDPALVGGMHRGLPALDARVIGPEPPSRRLDGKLYCFVDWLLPELSGLEMCRRLRELPATRDSHITMVLEASNAEDQRRALRAGADDYMLGPLAPDRLAERLAGYEAAATPPVQRGRLAHGELTVDLAAHQARWRGAAVALRPNEFRLLAHFIAHPDQVFTRTALIGEIGKDVGAIDERTVDVWIGRLRRALKAQGVPDPLRTVRALGYVLDSL
ncbi:MAG: response regulator transcription factor [Novosphingobium sp.]